jgi:lysozyme family protein
MADNFQTIHAFTVHWEGGLTDNPADPGGITNHGVSLRFLRQIRPAATAADIRALTRAAAAALFKTHFWDALGCARLPLPLACALYDGAVNMGPARACRQLQQAMNETGESQLDEYAPIAEDGVMGPATRALASALKDVRLDFYAARRALALRNGFYGALAAKRPEMKVFLTGWRNRVKALAAFLAELEREME